MGMTRFAPLFLAIGATLLLGAGCNKPSKEDCRKAIENMRALMHTTQLHTDVEGEVRRCNGGSKKDAVQCAMKATTLDELRACKFMHIPDDVGATDAGSGSSAASGSGSATSAGSGSATNTGSGSATPSGSDTATGSATGSVEGSGAGSATGSAASTGSGSAASAGSGSAASAGSGSAASAGSGSAATAGSGSAK